MLRMEGVCKSYGTVKALKATDLTLKAGEISCVVGETGSGKTTLAMVAAAAIPPERGRRIFEGRDMDLWSKQDYQSLARRIGIIYQNPVDAVSHRFSVFDIVSEPLHIQKRALGSVEIRDRVCSALNDVRLSSAPEFLKRYPHELNMGAIQRLCIARALIHDPVMVIADEPTSSLDPSVQAKVLKLLLGLQIEKGLTMLFVTHDIGIARKVADRISVMLAGRIVESGPAASILNHPFHPYTEMLVESAKGTVEPSLCAESGGRQDEALCPFLHRCRYATERCRERCPDPIALDGGHVLVWCWNPRG
jgi:peptide/nickel transport system ATP-binding protein